LFNYGADAFLIAIGSQIILSSQSLLVSRQLGPVEVAIWAVMTKAFAMVGNVIWRVIFNSMPAMAEMQVRGEHERLWDRYRALFVTVNVFAGICAVLFAACNSAFVTIWTHGEISWSPINDVLLGAWFLALTQQSCFNTLILYLKETRNLKYIYLIEGLVFVGVSLIVVRRAGITGMLVCSLCGTILFTWACGLWKVARLANKNLKVFLWEWQQPVLQILGFLIPCWLIARWLLNGASTWVQLVVLAGLLGGTGVIISIRFILPRPLITEIAGKLPAPMRRATLLLLWDNPVDHQKGC
jgi:O-antigen/teichoic acid export membrane protein